MRKIVFILLLTTSTLAFSAGEIVTFGVVPQQSASKLAKLWTPVLDFIADQTGLDIQFRTAPDIPTFQKRLAAGEYDFAYMNPYHYTIFHEAPGYEAIAKVRDKKLRGILVVQKDSAIMDLKELDNKILAFPAPGAFAASMITRAHLSKVAVDFQPKYVSSHDSVYRTVAKGLYPAGGGVIRTLKNVEPEIREQLRILWKSEGYTPHAIAAHPETRRSDSASVQKALLGMEKDARGKTLLDNLKIKGFEAAKDSDWNDVRDLKLSLPQDDR